MEQAVQWIAPVTTSIAAVMVALNGGARLTGYGFIVFAIGSIAWSAYGWMTAQDNLLIQNLILLAINLLGIWRWLGRTARYEEGAEAASEEAETPMVSAAALAGLDAVDREGERIGSVVDAMIACDSGRMAYATVSVGGVGGVGEKLFAVPWRDLRISTDRVEVNSLASRLHRASGVEADHWPGSAGNDWDRPAAE